MSTSLPAERQQIILSRLTEGGRVVAAELAREFATSEDTIRRDLRELAASGLCRRVYGGALPLSPAYLPLAQRESEAPERKAALGRAAAGLARPLQVLFIDAGSTNAAIARALPAHLALTVATNAPHIAAELIGKVELVLIGGRVEARSGAALGARALRDVAAMRFDLAFLGACALDAEAGLAAFDAEEADFKRAVAAQARQIAAALTNEKLAAAAPFAVIPAGRLSHLIVEPDAVGLEPFVQLGVNIIRAQ